MKATASLAPGPRAATDPFVDALIARMSIQEKLGQLTLYVGKWSDIGPRVTEGGEAEIIEGKVGTFYGIYGADYTRKMQEIAVEESRLGIPLLFAHDVVHGFRTIFPVPIAQAGSWNPTLVEEAARVAAVEMSAHGLHWTFAPMVDVARDPRWGRIVEGAGEDPFLGAVMAAAQVHGYQGDDLGANDTVLATAKHFVGYGAAEGGRDYNTVDVSEHTIREIFLPPFAAAVRAGVGSVMVAFNEIDGVPMHANDRLINGLLRREWGFDGVVVSDYTGILELIQHGVAADTAQAGRLALLAGVDVDLVSGIYQNLVDEIESGRLSESIVDASVQRVLLAKRRLGLFDDPYRYCDDSREQTVTLSHGHRASARQLARESIILLKNEGNLLPLPKNLKRIAVIGGLADDASSALGGWSAAGREDDVVTVLEGIRNAMPDAHVDYVKGADWRSDDISGIPDAVAAAEKADVVVIVVGEHRAQSAEASSRASLELPGAQVHLLVAVHGTRTPVVAVLTSGRPLAVVWMDEHIPSILQTWFLGTETGSAVADVLFGDYNPGGKLPVSMPRSVGQIPIHYNHKRTGRPPRDEEKYTSKYLDSPWTPLYPFGHGLSYTRFEYGTPRIEEARISLDMNRPITVEIDVTNTGERAGDEVVQLYVRDDVASVTRPVKQLRTFRRIHLEAGERRELRFTLGYEDLAFYDKDLKYVVEPGSFTVYVGTNSADVQEACFEVVANESIPLPSS